MNKINKKLFIPIALVLTAALFTGCVGGGAFGSGPEGVVQSYVSELNAGNLQGAAQYMVSEKAGSLDDMPQEQLDQVQEMMQAMNIEILSIELTEETEETATVEAEIKVSGSMLGQEIDETNTGTFTLVKEEGQWKISDSAALSGIQQ